MLPYFCILNVLIIIQWKFKLGYKVINKDDNKAFYIGCIILFLFAALRGNGSGDYFTYKQYSTLINSLGDLFNNNFPMEIGFRLLSFIINKIGLDSQWIIILMNAISIGCIYFFIKKYSKNKILSLIIFFPIFLMFDMHAARTAVAISIGALGLSAIEEKNILKYTIIILLATSFHRSAFILILLYPLSYIKIKTINAFIIMFLLFIVTEFIDIGNLLAHISNILDMNNISSKFINYSNSERFGYSYRLYDPRFIINLLVYYFGNRNYILKEKKNQVCVNAILFSNILTILFRKNTMFVTRFTSYYNIFSLILIPYIYENINISIKDKKLVKFILIVIYALISILIFIGGVDYKLYFI